MQQATLDVKSSSLVDPVRTSVSVDVASDVTTTCQTLRVRTYIGQYNALYRAIFNTDRIQQSIFIDISNILYMDW